VIQGALGCLHSLSGLPGLSLEVKLHILVPFGYFQDHIGTNPHTHTKTESIREPAYSARPVPIPGVVWITTQDKQDWVWVRESGRTNIR